MQSRQCSALVELLLDSLHFQKQHSVAFSRWQSPWTGQLSWMIFESTGSIDEDDHSDNNGDISDFSIDEDEEKQMNHQQLKHESPVFEMHDDFSMTSHYEVTYLDGTTARFNSKQRFNKKKHQKVQEVRKLPGDVFKKLFVRRTNRNSMLYDQFPRKRFTQSNTISTDGVDVQIHLVDQCSKPNRDADTSEFTSLSDAIVQAKKDTKTFRHKKTPVTPMPVLTKAELESATILGIDPGER